MQQRILRDRQYAVTHALTPHPATTLEVRLPSSRIKRARLVGQDRAAAPPQDVRAARDVQRRTVAHTLTFRRLTDGRRDVQRRYVTRNVDFLTGNLRL